MKAFQSRQWGKALTMSAIFALLSFVWTVYSSWRSNPYAQLEQLGATIDRDEAGRAIELHFFRKTIVDDDLRTLSIVPELRALTIQECDGLTNAGFMHLKHVNRLETLRLLHVPISHAGLDHIRKLEHLQTLELCALPINDATVEVLAALPMLRSLEIYNPGQLTDRGIKRLAGCRQIERIHISGANLGFRKVTALGALTRLRSLELPKTPISNDDLRLLLALPNLETVIVDAVEISDAGLEPLPAAALKTLYLPRAQLTDAGVARLVAITSLENVSLNGCARLTDAAMNELVRLPNLMSLDVTGTRITERGYRVLRRANPQCQIDWRPVPGNSGSGGSEAAPPSGLAGVFPVSTAVGSLRE